MNWNMFKRRVMWQNRALLSIALIKTKLNFFLATRGFVIYCLYLFVTKRHKSFVAKPFSISYVLTCVISGKQYIWLPLFALGGFISQRTNYKKIFSPAKLLCSSLIFNLNFLFFNFMYVLSYFLIAHTFMHCTIAQLSVGSAKL